MLKKCLYYKNVQIFIKYNISFVKWVIKFSYNEL